MLKKSLLLSLLTITSINMFSAANAKPTTATTVLKTCAKYVWENKITCAIAAFLMYDIYRNGFNDSIVKTTFNKSKTVCYQLSGDTQNGYANAQNLYKAYNSYPARAFNTASNGFQAFKARIPSFR